MPIGWSALRVSEALDEVERQIDAAQPFLDAAREKAKEARTLPNLAGYMDERLAWIIRQIDRITYVRDAIARARSVIPNEALEAERELSNQLSLM